MGGSSPLGIRTPLQGGFGSYQKEGIDLVFVVLLGVKGCESWGFSCEPGGTPGLHFCNAGWEDLCYWESGHHYKVGFTLFKSRG